MSIKRFAGAFLAVAAAGFAGGIAGGVLMARMVNIRLFVNQDVSVKTADGGSKACSCDGCSDDEQDCAACREGAEQVPQGTSVTASMSVRKECDSAGSLDAGSVLLAQLAWSDSDDGWF